MKVDFKVVIKWNNFTSAFKTKSKTYDKWPINGCDRISQN